MASRQADGRTRGKLRPEGESAAQAKIVVEKAATKRGTRTLRMPREKDGRTQAESTVHPTWNPDQADRRLPLMW